MSPHKPSKLILKKWEGSERFDSSIVYQIKDGFMKFKKDKTLGYMYVYDPNHILANKSGKVYEHIFVMVNHIGRLLNDDEVVHHKDRDRSNNDISNLELMTKSSHALLHRIEDDGFVCSIRTCLKCGKEFQVSCLSDQKYCSSLCGHRSRRKFDITYEELKTLVWQMPTTQVAKKLGVSDVAVSKRCKALGISKPPRGYWS